MAENVLSSSYTVGAGSSGCRVRTHPKQAVALQRFSRLRFSLFTENSENRFPRRSSRIPQLRGTPAVRHGFFLPIFSFCAQKNRAGTESAAPARFPVLWTRNTAEHAATGSPCGGAPCPVRDGVPQKRPIRRMALSPSREDCCASFSHARTAFDETSYFGKIIEDFLKIKNQQINFDGFLFCPCDSQLFRQL